LNNKTSEQSLGEEIANAITHGIGAGLSIAGLVLLIVAGFQRGDAADITGVMVFGISMVFLYLMSTFCHSFGLSQRTVRKVFRILDHSAIYVLIAGTYTPFCLSIIGGTKGFIILGIQWILAILGIVFSAVFYDKKRSLHTLIYLLMGWMIIFFIGSVYAALPRAGVILLLAGGLSYTIGVVFYAIRMFKYHHMIWHFFVLGGTICHFFLVYFYVIPK